MKQKSTLAFCLIFLIFLLTSIQVFSQTGEVRGRIYDHKNNQGIPYANIIIDGNHRRAQLPIRQVFIFCGRLSLGISGLLYL